jgi:hypothetical protein
MKGILYRPFEERDREACLELYNEVHPEGMSQDHWQWRNTAGIAGKALIETAWDGELLVGMYGIIPMRLFNGEKEIRGALSDIAVTHPQYRYRGIFGEIGERLYRRAMGGGIAVIYGFPTDHSVHGFKKRLRWDSITGSLPLYCWGCHGKDRPDGEYEIREVKEISPEFDRLWEVLAGGMLKKKTVVVRNAGYLKWRFAEEPGRKYSVFMAFEGRGEPAGYAVVCRESGKGEELCRIVDMVTSDTGCFRYLIGYLKNLLGMSMIMKTPEGSLFYNLAGGMGFKKGGRNYYFGRRILDPMTVLGKEWHYTAADEL